ncbi:MAG: hypothetical protein DBX44_04950 [Oscillospiraceae bacterium]|nr:MAG: hypothetical protein DBX44_04950 [Oscillospiraceae bacterium]
MKFKVFGCCALRRELSLLSAFSPHEIDLEILPEPPSPAVLQQRIDAAEGFDYILPCVGSCLSNGLQAGHIPIVLPRAHNCAHLLLGSLTRYHQAFSENEDAPRWLLGNGCHFLSPAFGNPCTVSDSLFTNVQPRREGREYAANLSLLRDYLNGDWDEARFLLLERQEQAVVDPVEILSAEPST